MNWYLKVLRQYADFDGRARPKEYWMFILFNLIVGILLGIIIGIASAVAQINLSLLSVVYQLAVLVPSIAVGVRRMHDSDHRGWWLLFPFVNLYFAIISGTPGQNRFGPDPMAAPAQIT
jgi:uncharacterized membrane protein YhaH (DUF805 family)